LAELANIRQSVFENVEKRMEYVSNFATNMVNLFQSPAKGNYILKDRIIFKEFVKIPHKFEVKFGLYSFR